MRHLGGIYIVVGDLFCLLGQYRFFTRKLTFGLEQGSFFPKYRTLNSPSISAVKTTPIQS